MMGLACPDKATLDELVEAFAWMVWMLGGTDGDDEGPRGWLDP